MRSFARFFALLFFIHLSCVSGGQVLRPEHEASRMEGFTGLVMEEGILSFKTTGPAEGLLVIESNAPLRLESASHVDAVLSPGWDGTLGYKMYGLSLSVAGAGEAEVVFRMINPPRHPLPTTQEELTGFREQVKNRSSSFPCQVSGLSAWQSAYRDTLVHILMGGGFPERIAVDMQMEYEQDYPNFHLLAFSYQSKTDRRNTALLSIPKHVQHAPLLVALHGHESTWGTADSAAYREGHVDDFCSFFANRGWAVLQPATMDHSLQHSNWTLQGEWTWDVMRAMDVCEAYPTIDLQRVAVCGLSTGGHLAMNLLALDERIKAGVVGCILSTWNHYNSRFRMPPHCDCGISQQLAPVMEQCDWAALAAPKPVQFQHGLLDASFCPGADASLLDLHWNTGILPIEEYRAMFGEIERAYGIFGKGMQVTTRFHEGAHRINNRMAYDWLRNMIQQ